MITATTTKGPVTANNLEDLAYRLSALAPSGVTLEWGAERCHVDLPSDGSAASWLFALGLALVGEEVEAGEIAQDYDHGSIFERNGGLWVAWELSQQSTLAAIATLRPLDAARLARARASV